MEISDILGRDMTDSDVEHYVNTQLDGRIRAVAVESDAMIDTTDGCVDDPMDIPSFPKIVDPITDNLDVHDLHSRYLQIYGYYKEQSISESEEKSGHGIFDFMSWAILVYTHYCLEHGLATSFETALTVGSGEAAYRFYALRSREIVKLGVLMGRANMILDKNSKDSDVQLTEGLFCSRDYLAGIDACQSILNNVFQIVLNVVRGAGMVSGQIQNYNVSAWPRWCPYAGEEEYETHQMIELEALNDLATRGCRRKGNFVYMPVFNKKRQFCYSFTQWILIEEYVSYLTSPDVRHDLWVMATTKQSTCRYLVGRLSTTDTGLFPVIKTDRHVFAFKNAVYDAQQDKIFRYGEDDLPHSIVACNYIDTDVCDGDGLGPTPTFDSLFELQEFDEGVARMLMFFIGRMLYDLGEHDSFQIVPYLWGMAGTGKGTLISIIEQLYDRNDVGLLVGPMEQTFGLATVGKDKNVFLCPEVTSKFSMDQSDFNVICEGGFVKMAVKNKTATDERWRAPGLMAGNIALPFRNTHNNIGRRVPTFKFHKAPVDVISDMRKRISGELPSILIKCNKAYRGVMEEFGRSVGIWKILQTVAGDYFSAQVNEMLNSGDVVGSFLESSTVEFGDFYVPEKEFKATLFVHCEENGFKRPTWKAELYSGAFIHKKLKSEMCVREWPIGSGNESLQPFIIGCRFRE